jgi:hypothetical protein
LLAQVFHSFIQGLHSLSSHNYFQGLPCLFRCKTVFSAVLFAQVLKSFLLSLKSLRRCYTVFFRANIVCASATHILQVMHCCTGATLHYTVLYGPAMTVKELHNFLHLHYLLMCYTVIFRAVSFARYYCSKLTAGAAMFAQVLDNLLQALHCLLRCYKAFFRAYTLRVCIPRT